MAHRSRRVLIVVENLPARRDRRVWREAQALVAAGYGVSVISPAAPDDEPERVVDGIRLYTYRPPPEPSGAVGYIWEYAYSFAMISRLSVKAWRNEGFGALQACNPPDVFFPLGAVYRRLGRCFVFDHHDLAPEVYITRYGRDRGVLLRILRFLERATFRTADHVIATNESYRRVAVERGGCLPSQVTVVRNGPDLELMPQVPACPELKAGRPLLGLWFGNMGPQDGVDRALRAIEVLVHRFGRTDCHFAFVGRGDVLDDMRRLATRLRLDEWVTFTGWIEDELAFAYLSTADVGLSPDPPSPLNDVSTMNKTMEYMAFAVPVVAFDLHETRVSAGDAALYAVPDDIGSFAELVDELLSDPARRAELGALGRRRVEDSLAWSLQREDYVAVYRLLLGPPPPPDGLREGQGATTGLDEAPPAGLPRRLGADA